ncbi:MAG: transposase [Cytophagales bacterium]|nr:transposase [Cytophagales bacterium]
MRTKRKFTAEFKAKVALEAIKEVETISTLAQKYQLHPTQINGWKKEFLANASSIFESKSTKKEEKTNNEEALYSKIGKLQVEVDFLKKALS